MDRDRRTALVVGFFALGALAMFAVAVVSLTGDRGFWVEQYRLVAYFQNVQGLIEGAPVRLAGKDIGTIESVSFGPLGGDHPPVRVGLRIDAKLRERIRSDSRATIGTIGLLGDKYIEVSMGSPEAEVLPDGAELASTTPLDVSDVMTTGTQALEGVSELARNVNRIVAEFQQAKGPARIAESVKALADVAKQVREGQGLLHSLIYDPYRGEGVESITRSLASLDEILGEVARGDGLLHSLIYEPAGEQVLVRDLRDASARLDSVLRKIDEGQGTLGLLVSDPTLYDDLKLLVGGAQRSVVVRSLVSLAGDRDEPAQ